MLLSRAASASYSVAPSMQIHKDNLDVVIAVRTTQGTTVT